MIDQPPNRKVDRRIQRTRQLLRDAMIELVTERGYENITIQDITDHANVARTTFYLHFKDKDDLLIQTFKDTFEEMMSGIPTIKIKTPDGKEMETFDPDYPGDYEHVVRYADFYRVMLGRKGSPAFVHDLRLFLIELLKRVMPQMSYQPRLPIDMIYYSVVNAQIGLYIWWLDHLDEFTPQEMARIGYQLLGQGYLWAMGFENDPFDPSNRV